MTKFTKKNMITFSINKPKVFTKNEMRKDQTESKSTILKLDLRLNLISKYNTDVTISTIKIAR